MSFRVSPCLTVYKMIVGVAVGVGVAVDVGVAVGVGVNVGVLLGSICIRHAGVEPSYFCGDTVSCDQDTPAKVGCVGVVVAVGWLGLLRRTTIRHPASIGVALKVSAANPARIVLPLMSLPRLPHLRPK